MMRLSETEITEELKKIEGWAIKDNKLHKEFQFDSFNQAFGFMTRVDLTTHDAGGITNNDINLARILNSLV